MRSLIRGLPPESAFRRATDETWFWTQTDELLATVIEVVDHGNRLFFKAHSKKGTQPPKPIRVPRPHRGKTEAVRMSSTEEIARFMGSRRRRSGRKRKKV